MTKWRRVVGLLQALAAVASIATLVFWRDRGRAHDRGPIEPRPNDYGATLAEYEGSGTLQLAGEPETQCVFQAFQLRRGDVILLCRVPELRFFWSVFSNLRGTLTGTTSDGRTVKATGLFSTNYLPPLPNPEPAVYAAYRSDTLDLPSGVESTSSRFAITNMVLGNHELAIRHPSGVAKLTRADGYPDSVRRLRTVKGIDVTAWLEIAGLDATSRDAAADDICYLLSLARGTKIQWISRIDYSSEGVEVHRHHSSRITKAYCPLPVIDPRELSDTAAFLETSLPIYLAQRDKWKLSRRLIDSYLDAKAEADYLQTRGVKLAVVMEMLKQTFLDATQQQGLVRSSPQFSAMAAKLKRAISTVLSAAGWNESERAVVYGKLRGLNRVPFQDLVLSLCAHLDLTLPEADVRLFVKCRNSLVHHGRFYCETAGVNPARSVQPHDRPVDEYFWLIHVLDRVFLRIVGYRGPYIDWSAAEHPVRRETF